MSEVRVDKVTTKALSVVDDAGKEVATLTAVEGGGGGLWVKGPGDHQVAIYSVKGQTAIGIYDRVEGGPFMPLALTVDNDVPTVQFRDESGSPQFLTLDAVKKAVDAAAKA